MVAPVVIGAIGSALGGLFGGNAAKRAAEENARANLESTKLAVDAAKFRPYAVTTGFGSSLFNTDDQTAGYTLDSRLQALRDQYYGLGEQALGGIELDPTKAANDLYNRVMETTEGSRLARDIKLRADQLAGGRVGYGISPEAVGAGAGTGGMINPERYTNTLADAVANRKLALEAIGQSQADIDRGIARGSGLLQSGFGVENLGMGALAMGADIGNRAQVSGANQAQALLSGGQAAAQANLAAGLNTANLYQNLGKQFSGMFSGVGGSTPTWLNNLQQGYTNSADYGGYGYGTGYQGVY
jgi:hypothetical protein